MYNTHISSALPRLHRSLMEIVAIINQPERDDYLLKLAGLSLERALFPLLVQVASVGPIGVVDLADRVGRDYTTVSRQVARLEDIGLVERRPSPEDKRIREALITPAGRIATDAIDVARQKLALDLFKDWSESDILELVRLTERLASGLSQAPGTLTEPT